MTTTAAGHTPAWTLGDRLRKVRRDAGYNARDFADALGIHVSSLAHYETDRARPRDLADLAARVHAVTGVPVAWVMGQDAGSCTEPKPGPPTQVLFIDVPLFTELV